MQFPAPSMLLLSITTFFAWTVFAKPVPAAAAAAAATTTAFHDIEERWAQGQNEQEIHSGLTHRDMTPAWPITRDRDSGYEGAGFALATDERSIERSEKRSGRRAATQSLGERMKEFAERVLMRTKGADEESGVGAGVDGEEAVVLRPRKEMRYYFTE